MRPLPLAAPLTACRLCGATEDQRPVGRERFLDWGQWLVRCGQCGGGYLSADLTPAALAEFYAHHFRQLYTITLGPELDLALAQDRVARMTTALARGQRLAELGSGFGSFLAAAHRAAPHLTLVAVEPDHTHRERDLAGIPVTFIAEDALADHGPYDVIVLFHVLEHLTDPQASLRRLASLLAPGGRIFVEVPDCRAPWTGWSNVHGAHLSYFTRPSLTRLCQHAGVQPVSIGPGAGPTLWLEAQAGGTTPAETASLEEIRDFDQHLARYPWTIRDRLRRDLRRLAVRVLGPAQVGEWQHRKHTPVIRRWLNGPPPRQDFAGIGIDGLTMSETLERIYTAIRQRQPLRHGDVNVAKLIQARDDPQLAADLADCDIVSADGMGIVWGARWLGLAIPERVTGIDVMMALLAECAVQGWRPYFLGAQPDILDQAITKLRQQFPTLILAGSHHGYFTAEDEPDLVDAIAASGADCLFVAMSSPLKERFLARHGARLGVPFTMGVGGALDVVAGLRWRAPIWMQRLGLEWLARLVQEPIRLGPRYLITNSRFAWLLWRQRRP